jgi:hypothetical protein
MATWSPTSLFNRRAYGPENLSPMPQKDFCNTINLRADVSQPCRNAICTRGQANVRFSNRPFGVKHFQTIHHCAVDVARRLALLFGIGTQALVWGFLCQEIRQGRASFSFVGFLI